MFNNGVKAVFLALMGAVAAVILYFVLFGQMKSGSTGIIRADPSGERWEGALFYAARAIESPISRYYYEYCYKPGILEYYYLDKDLGYDIDSLDVPSTGFDGFPGNNVKSSVSSAVSGYTTGWK